MMRYLGRESGRYDAFVLAFAQRIDMPEWEVRLLVHAISGSDPFYDNGKQWGLLGWTEPTPTKEGDQLDAAILLVENLDAERYETKTIWRLLAYMRFGDDALALLRKSTLPKQVAPFLADAMALTEAISLDDFTSFAEKELGPITARAGACVVWENATSTTTSAPSEWECISPPRWKDLDFGEMLQGTHDVYSEPWSKVEHTNSTIAYRPELPEPVLSDDGPLAGALRSIVAYNDDQNKNLYLWKHKVTGTKRWAYEFCVEPDAELPPFIGKLLGLVSWLNPDEMVQASLEVVIFAIAKAFNANPDTIYEIASFLARLKTQEGVDKALVKIGRKQKTSAWFTLLSKTQ